MNAVRNAIAGDGLQVIVFLLAAVTLVALVLGLRMLLSSREDPLARRIRRSTLSEAEAMAEGRLDSKPEASFVESTLRPIASMATPSDEQELEGLRARLQHAGYRSDQALTIYLVCKVVLCLLAAGLAFAAIGQDTPPDKVALYTVLAMIAGFYGPNLWLSGRTSERQATINRSLPDAIDLLVTCVEAGLALEGSLNRVAQEITLSSPMLAGELKQAGLELRAGLSRGEAFRRMASRTGVAELKYLASVVVQAEMFGTSVAKSLRVMAEAMRVRRTHSAEKKAAAAAVKMTLPLVMCILPSLFTVLLGPAVLNIMRTMLPAMAGGGGQ